MRFHSQHKPVGYVVSPYVIKEQSADRLILESAMGARIFMGFAFACIGIVAGAIMRANEAGAVLYAIAIGLLVAAVYWAAKTDQIEIDGKRRVVERRSQWLNIRISTSVMPFDEIEMIVLRYGDLSMDGSNSVCGWALEIYPHGTNAYIKLNNSSNAADMARLADAVEKLTGRMVDRSAA